MQSNDGSPIQSLYFASAGDETEGRLEENIVFKSEDLVRYLRILQELGGLDKLRDQVTASLDFDISERRVGIGMYGPGCMMSMTLHTSPSLFQAEICTYVSFKNVVRHV